MQLAFFQCFLVFTELCTHSSITKTNLITMKITKKAPAKKKATKKAAAKKTTKSVVKPSVFTWSDEQKTEAHAALLAQYNRNEPNQLKKLSVTYHADGTATCQGRVKNVYKHKM